MTFSVNVVDGTVRPITVLSTSVDVPILPGDGYLLGWSFRDSSGEAPFATEGSVTSPAAAAVIATVTPTVSGQYSISWEVGLAGTVAAADSNNFGLYAGATLIATSVNPGAVGVYPQDPVTYSVPSSTAISVKAIGAGTVGAVYSAQISGSPGPGFVSAFELHDGARTIGEGSAMPGGQMPHNVGGLGIKIQTGLTLHIVSGAIQGVVYCLYDLASN